MARIDSEDKKAEPPNMNVHSSSATGHSNNGTDNTTSHPGGGYPPQYQPAPTYGSYTNYALTNPNNYPTNGAVRDAYAVTQQCTQQPSHPKLQHQLAEGASYSRHTHQYSDPNPTVTSHQEPGDNTAGASHTKVRSYDSFKRIIEGPTYHPATHSRESSAASTGSALSAGVTSVSGSASHSRNASRESVKSAGNAGGGRTMPAATSTPRNDADVFVNAQENGYNLHGNLHSHHQDSQYKNRVVGGGHDQFDGNAVGRRGHVPVPLSTQQQQQPSRTFFGDDYDRAAPSRNDLPGVHSGSSRVRNAPQMPHQQPRVIANPAADYNYNGSHQQSLVATRQNRPEPDGADACRMAALQHNHYQQQSRSHEISSHSRENPQPQEHQRRCHYQQLDSGNLPSQQQQQQQQLQQQPQQYQHPQEYKNPQTATETPKRRRRPLLQRQNGVNLQEDAYSVALEQPRTMITSRPKTEYLDRTGVYGDVASVKFRERPGRAERGYVNSAYIEDNLKTIPENMAFSDGDLDRNAQYSQNKRDQNGNYSIGNEDVNTQRTSNRVQVQVDVSPHRQALKKTVNEAIRERDQNAQMRRQYVQNKHRSNPSSVRQISGESGSYRISQGNIDRLTSSIKGPHTRINSPQKSYTNQPKYANSGTSQNKRSGQNLQRPLSVSPERTRNQRRTEMHYGPAEPQEVGLQSYSALSDDRKGAAIMVHVAPPNERIRNNSGKTSPVIINVGEMTWERLKRQVSKKNVYVVQKDGGKEKAKRTKAVTQQQKPRTHFTLSLFTMCFCLSPLGFIAMIFAVCSASAYKDKEAGSARCYSKVSLVLSVLGIVTTLATAAILVGTNTIPVMGRYGEPEGN